MADNTLTVVKWTAHFVNDKSPLCCGCSVLDGCMTLDVVEGVAEFDNGHCAACGEDLRDKRAPTVTHIDIFPVYAYRAVDGGTVK